MLNQGIKINKNSIKKYSEKIFLSSIYILAFSLPLGIFFSKIAFIILVSVWLIFVITNGIPNKKLNSKSAKFFLFAILLYFVFHFIGFIYTSNLFKGYRNVSVKIYLLLFPIIFITNQKTIRSRIGVTFGYFVLGNLTTSLIMLGRAFVRSISFDNGKIVFQASVDARYSFFESISQGGNYFFYSDLSFFGHPTYVAMYVLVAIIILLFYNKISDSSIKFIDRFFANRKVRIATLIFLLSVIFLLSSKAVLLSTFVVVGLYFVVSDMKNKYAYVAVFMLFMVFFGARNSRINTYLQYAAEKSFFGSELKSGTQRFFLWQAGLEIYKENYLLGVGTGDVGDELRQHSRFDKLKKLNNIHNEYLESLVKLGIPGVFSFLLVLFAGFWYSYQKNNYFLFLFFLIFSVNFIFETMLNRVGGTLFFGFFAGFIFIFDEFEFSKEFYVKKEKICRFLLFLLNFVVLIWYFSRGLNLDFYSSSISKVWFEIRNPNLLLLSDISTLTKVLWAKIFYVPNLFWLRVFDITLICISLVVFYDLFEKKYQKNRIIFVITSVLIVVLLSFTNIFYINSLFFLSFALVVRVFYDFFKKKTFGRKRVVLPVIIFIFFIKIISETNFQNSDYYKLRQIKSFSENVLVRSNTIVLLGVKDNKDEIENFDELVNFVQNPENKITEYYTNIRLLPFLVNKKGVVESYEFCSKSDKILILKKDLQKQNIILDRQILLNNDRYIVLSGG